MNRRDLFAITAASLAARKLPAVKRRRAEIAERRPDLWRRLDAMERKRG
jgi:hypothetical protein